ncbi:hypothetical protein [Blastomonas aquatica]|uniref:hypothetical protein n=1 Tax=Blastomonas aquatica TaxID=1510276 RepID=UPI00166567B1|nr:hypothetical protein [Blastomonas aquatica]
MTPAISTLSEEAFGQERRATGNQLTSLANALALIGMDDHPGPWLLDLSLSYGHHGHLRQPRANVKMPLRRSVAAPVTEPRVQPVAGTLNDTETRRTNCRKKYRKLLPENSLDAALLRSRHTNARNLSN